MSYLCEMKKSCFLGLLIGAFISLLFARQGSAQLVDQTHFYFSDSIGSEISFLDTFTWQYIFQPTEFNFSGTQGITVYPSSLMIGGGKGGQFTVSVTIKTDSLPYVGASRDGCLGSGLLTGPAMVLSNGQWYVIIGGYIYDPKIQGRIRMSSDTLNFGAVPVRSVADIAPAISVDTVGSIFRKLIPLNVWAPFTAWDSITPQFDSCYLPNGGGDFYFSTVQVKQYVDTAYLYDPIRKDSTMLILLGEGVVAGVSPDIAEANSLRINPNPCDRSAAISLSGGDIDEVTVQNILGERVIESRMEPCNNFNMNTSELPEGIYFVEVRSQQGQYRQRIIVAH